MDKCFLPAIKEIAGNNESQAYDFNYDVSKAKSTAASKEGNRASRSGGYRQDIPIRLDSEYIGPVWMICLRRLKYEMENDESFNAFTDFQFFSNSKGHKDLVKAQDFSDLMTVYEEKV